MFSGIKKGQALPALFEVSIGQTPSALLSCTHYERLMRVTNEQARLWYMKEAAEQMWSYRTLDRNISTQYYSIPSPEAEPFKLWIAQIASERSVVH